MHNFSLTSYLGDNQVGSIVYVSYSFFSNISKMLQYYEA